MNKLGWKKKLIFYCILFPVTCLGIELVFRVVFAFMVGPSVLVWGTRFRWNIVEQRSNQSIAWHDNKLVNYSKYFPHQSRVTHDKKTGEIIPVTINSKGFRGIDFNEQADNNTIRVVTLGGSSTFGYYDRDNETYPYYMQKLLNEDYHNGKSYEAINLGIPHQNSSQILSLFVAEALPLKPNVVTFYEGNNDAWFAKFNTMKQVRRGPFLHSAMNYAAHYSLVFEMLNEFLIFQFEGFTKEHLDQYAETICEKFLNNISLIHQQCKSRDILFIVATQQKTSMYEQNDRLVGVTYKQEVEQVERKLSQTGYMTGFELDFLLHDILMENLVKWASANNVPLVDIIKAMDQHRDELLSVVHISPAGNRLIAKAFADEIRKQVRQEMHQ